MFDLAGVTSRDREPDYNKVYCAVTTKVAVSAICKVPGSERLPPRAAVSVETLAESRTGTR